MGGLSCVLRGVAIMRLERSGKLFIGVIGWDRCKADGE